MVGGGRRGYSTEPKQQEEGAKEVVCITVEERGEGGRGVKE